MNGKMKDEKKNKLSPGKPKMIGNVNYTCGK